MSCSHLPGVTCAECRPQDGPSYPDDVVAVMRDTITALREQVVALCQQVVHLEACNEQLRIGESEALAELRRVRAQRDGSVLPEGI